MTEHTPDYWYVGYANGTFDFFCDKRKLTEAEWRKEAPATEVERLDRELSDRSLDR